MRETNLTGIRLMLQASVAFSFMGVCVKFASSNIPSIEIVFFRSLIGFIFVMIHGFIQKKSLVGSSSHKRLLLRSLSGFIALVLFFYGIEHLPLGTAVLLNDTSPFFVVLLSWLFLKEKTKMILLSFILISFVGVYLLIQGQFSRWNLSVLAALSSAFFAGISYVTIRSIRHRASEVTIIFYFTSVCSIGAFFLSLPNFVWPQPRDYPFIFGVGIFAYFAQVWMTRAYQKAPGSVVSPFMYLTPILSFVYGLLLWDERLNALSLLGAGLTIVGGCLISRLSTKK